MIPETKQNNDGDIIVLLLILVMLFSNPIELAKSITTSPKPIPTTTENLYFHVARFYGSDITPTKAVLEEEIERAADEFGIQRNIFKALVKVESGGNPKAISHVGARGIAQIMPFNAKRCGLSSADKLWDAILNLRCGAQILSEEIEQHGDVHAALTVYNCGKVRCPAGKQYANKVIALSRKFS